MKWKDLCSSVIGAFALYIAWQVFEGGRVYTRGGYSSSLTKESHPIIFWFEVAVFAFVGAAVTAYGLIGLLGYSNVTARIDTVTNKFSFFKWEFFLICALLVILVAGLGWLVVEELLRTSRLRAGGG